MKDKLCEITFQPLGLKVKVPENTTILKAAEINNLPLEGMCNGRGTCGKCLVQASGMLTEPQLEEKERLEGKLSEGWRLACQAKVLGNVEIRLPDKQEFRTIAKGKIKQYEFDPVIKVSSEQAYGIAVDIGTTSIVASLIDLSSDGKEVAVASCLNPQTQFGADVITRITYAHGSADNVIKLKELVLGGINELISKVCKEKDIQPKEIYHITVAANNTMLHLLVGVDPFSLAVAPYNPVFVDYREYQASELGIAAPNAVVSLLPSLSAFVGADILAGVIAIDFHKLTEPALFIDIGTNGEIVANVNGKLAATSSAAGPALEGMNIHCGCRAEDGAVSSVQIEKSGQIKIKTIGSAKIKGICGSGLVELVAELVESGVILPSGRFAQSDDLPAFLAQRMIEHDGQPAFLIDADSKTMLTQKDVRQVQLAKAAIAAAVDILFQRLEIELSSVKKIYIAGAFGYHLKKEALETIGLLPAGLNVQQVEFVGNTAKEGARLCMVSRAAADEIIVLQKALVSLELSYAPEFMDNYVSQMNFPNIPKSKQEEKIGIS
ncbi:ASKHA domain-containing protein [Desulfolucanica intricata]|uniref:ASKHA domain-containing protein n=1 Tax=Desulfolucanica intricata TaxID=1285191 RepID=UPI0008319C5C|nr:ASKHA domain-containing protein [Desulfolucanica intricata]